MNRQASLLIWDSADAPPSSASEHEQAIVLWQGYSIEGLGNAVSILQWVEEHADSIRQRYLAWIYEIGKNKIHGKRIMDHLQLQSGFSAWWMSLLVEKSNLYKSSQIDDAMRLIGFEDWLRGRSIESLVLVTKKATLVECLRHLCSQQGIDFVWQHSSDSIVAVSRLRWIYSRLPNTLQALIWLARHLKSRWWLRGAGLEEWRQSQGKITFVSYFLNLVPDAAKQGVFESHYWGHLPEMLLDEGVNTNWLHVYNEYNLLPTARDTAKQICRFNKAGLGIQRHVTLDTFLSLAVVGRALRDWLCLFQKGIGVRMQNNMPRLGKLDLWPLFKSDWNNSISGVTAMRNVLTFNLFKTAFSVIPEQRIGVYLFENQGWEFGMLQAWRFNQHGKAIGYAHSTVRYWDLRYFFDPRCYVSKKQNTMPFPDNVAVNGPAARDSYLAGGLPVEKLVEVEALRFLHLNQIGSTTSDVYNVGVQPVVAKVRRLRLLVLTDYVETYTRVQMQYLSDVVDCLPEGVIITVKPHPARPICPQDYPQLSFSVSESPIYELLPHTDIAYSSSVTSAAVDAYCAGVPVITALDQITLNISPLRGCAEVSFVGTPKDLCEKIWESENTPTSEVLPTHFFYLNIDLSRWRKLLRLY